ncbi:hypothetical protein NKH61_04315 [Mesorhizobium sp. M1005]|uniref:hypothetical protein n=1 Tax=unclassified Mesorhizobium TaxID=325217 RepID=UPI003334C8B8
MLSIQRPVFPADFGRKAILSLLRLDSYQIVARIAFPAAFAGVLLFALLPEQLLQGLGLAFTFDHDKLNHAAAFVVLAALGSLGWPERKAKLIVLLVLTGAAIEGLQAVQLIGRDPDLFDWVADCAGIACGLMVAGWTKRLAGGLP